MRNVIVLAMIVGITATVAAQSYAGALRRGPMGIVLDERSSILGLTLKDIEEKKANCPCGPECKCGCNDGFPCECGKVKTTTLAQPQSMPVAPRLNYVPTPVVIPTARPVQYYQMPAPAYAPTFAPVYGSPPACVGGS